MRWCKFSLSDEEDIEGATGPPASGDMPPGGGCWLPFWGTSLQDREWSINNQLSEEAGGVETEKDFNLNKHLKLGAGVAVLVRREWRGDLILNKHCHTSALSQLPCTP